MCGRGPFISSPRDRIKTCKQPFIQAIRGNINPAANLHTDGLRLHKSRIADQSDSGTSKTNTPHLVKSLSCPEGWVVSKAAPLPREGALRDSLTVALCFPRPYPALVLELFFRSAGGVIWMTRTRHIHEEEATIDRKTVAPVSVVLAMLVKMCSASVAAAMEKFIGMLPVHI